jgi:hypothetical protein
LYSTVAVLEAAAGIEEDTPAASWGGRSSGGGCSLEETRREDFIGRMPWHLYEEAQGKRAKGHTEHWEKLQPGREWGSQESEGHSVCVGRT